MLSLTAENEKVKGIISLGIHDANKSKMKIYCKKCATVYKY